MQYDAEEYAEILNIFKAESEDIIQELNNGFLELEKNPENKKPLKKLLRSIHSLKGAARMLGFNSIQDISHKIEDILTYWKQDSVSIDKNCFQLFYDICDFLNETVDKSVKKKSDYTDSKVMLFINKLENLTESIPEAEKEEKQKGKISLNNTATDINAVLLEIMFLLEKDEESDDINEVITVVLENLNRLNDFFKAAEYSEIKNDIDNIINVFNDNSVEKEKKLSLCRDSIKELRKKIYSVFKDVNLPNEINSSSGVKITNDKEKSVSENLINLYNSLLISLKSAKTDKNYIPKIIKMLEELACVVKSEQIEQIIIKSVNILKIYINKSREIDNDSYMVLMQCVYYIRSYFYNSEGFNLNNYNFLIQRLNVVQDMLDISDIKGIKITGGNFGESPLLNFSGNIENIKKNTGSYELNEIKTMRVDTSKLDTLIAQINELMVNGIKTREHLNGLNDINDKLIKWNSAGKKVLNYIKYIEKRGYLNSLDFGGENSFFKKTQDFFMNNFEIISEVQREFDELYNVILEDDNGLQKTVLELDTIAKSIRVLPLAAIFHSFHRMVRDIAIENNKKIDFIVTGSDTTVDKKIIEEIKTPLIHIIRNSVSHGIEAPEDRIKNGKNEVGTVKLTAKIVENNVIISIEDDGYGINLEKVKNTALKKGLLKRHEVENMSDEQLMKLLFMPGFSTEDSINEISGRGIGLDVVKTKINNLNGDIYIDSVLGKGCRVTIKIPLSMSTIKTFIVCVNNQKYAIPVTFIKYVKKIKSDEIFDKNAQNYIIYDDHSIPVYFLSEVFGEKYNIAAKDGQYTVVIIENQDKQAAFITDELIGSKEIILKKPVPPIMKIKNISGFSTLPTGEICLIINPYELIRNTLMNNFISEIDINKLTSSKNIQGVKNIIIYGEDLNFLQHDLSEIFNNVIMFKNIHSVYDYIDKNDTNVVICRFSKNNQESVSLLKHIKTDEKYQKIKVIFMSDMNIYDTFDGVKPDLNTKMFEYNQAEFIRLIENL